MIGQGGGSKATQDIEEKGTVQERTGRGKGQEQESRTGYINLG